MARTKKDPKLQKAEDDLAHTVDAIDKCEGRIIRYVNKLSELRIKRQRVRRNIAKMLAGPTIGATPAN